MGSSKVIPYETSSTDLAFSSTRDRFRQRHGTNTITNNDEIPVEQSVLNSRYLISEYLEKHQKIYLVKEQFDFTKATDDILEQREQRLKDKVREEKRLAAITYTKNWKVKPY